MILDLKTLFNGGEDVSVDYCFTPNAADLEGVKSVKVLAKLTGTVSFVKLSADVSFAHTRTCDRCLDLYSEKYHALFDHTLVTSLNHEDNDELILVDDYKIDLDELILSDILLSMPMKNLCNQNCKGLCGKCGKNLNEGDCGCDKKQVDPRLEALLQLID